MEGAIASVFVSPVWDLRGINRVHSSRNNLKARFTLCYAGGRVVGRTQTGVPDVAGPTEGVGPTGTLRGEPLHP